MTNSTADVGGGARDFDFLHGAWIVSNRKLTNPLDETCDEWLDFEAEVETRPLLAGTANIDEFLCHEFPNRPGFEALALRLYDPASGLWRIWWGSTAGAGLLDTPLTGRFDGDQGLFECDDVLAGRPTRVRFIWQRGEQPHWTQLFSFDKGESWSPNWEMSLRRR